MARGQKAWLLRWEWGGAHAAVEDKIAGILQPRMGRARVAEIVEHLYALHVHTLAELADNARQPKHRSYKAAWHNSHCYCGSNPSLHAIYVHDLRVSEDPESGLETASWVLPTLKRIDVNTLEVEVVRGPIKESLTRSIAGPLSDREIGRHG